MSINIAVTHEGGTDHIGNVKKFWRDMNDGLVTVVKEDGRHLTFDDGEICNGSPSDEYECEL